MDSTSNKHKEDIEIKRLKKKHNKSKNGCLACKERKVKCDQKMPICSYCDKKNIKCPYLFMTPYQIYRILEDQKQYIKNNTNDNIFDKNNKNDDKVKNGFQINSTEYDDLNDDDETEDECFDYDEIDDNNDNDINNKYVYQMAGSINLNNEMPNSKESIYKTHEMENIILSSSSANMTKYAIIENTQSNHNNCNNNNNTNTHLPLNSLKLPSKSQGQSQSQNKKPIPLSKNTRISTSVFSTSHNLIINSFTKFIEMDTLVTSLVMKRDFVSLAKVLNGKYLDTTIFYNYIQNISIAQIYDKLLRKSLLLLALDYYKNIILKQKILPDTTYEAKLSISSELEKSSVVSIDSITRIIKEEYLPYFEEFEYCCRNVFLASFIVLDDCLGYHFKSGLKYDMSFEDGEKAIQLAGIFTTGMYAMIMARSHESLLMTATNILSAYLITNFKKSLIPNYHIKIFEDFKNVIDKLSISCHSDVNYENLKIFSNQYNRLLKDNTHDGIFEFNAGFIFKSFNSFKSILPFDLSDLLDDTTNLSETEIVIKLAYYTLNELINSLVPGIKNIVAGVFSGVEYFIYNSKYTKILMKLFKKIKSKKLQLAAIFFIRLGKFLNNRWMYYKQYLVSISLDKLLDDDENISIHQRYLRLRELKKNGVMDEIQMKTFLLEKGQFIRRWNYPNKTHLKRSRFSKVSNNKIMNHFEDNEDLLIEDFNKKNNGFFSYDHDVSVDLTESKSIVKETKYIDGTEIKVLWKLITYIRINNL